MTITGNGAVEGTPYDEAMKSAITSVTISEGITSIGDSVFVDCANIKSVYWNAKNCNRTIFGTIERVFNEDGSIQNVLGYPVESFVLGEQVEIIPERLCNNMQKLTEIVIPNSVKEIGDNAFRQCYGLTKITIGDHVKKIDKRAFQNCSSLTSIIIPNSVTELGDTAFYQCSMLSDVTLGDGLRKIPAGAFLSCKKLEDITFGNQTIEIGASAFKNCGFKSIVIPNTVENIGDYAFRICEQLTDVTIGDGVTTIGIGAFQECRELTNVTLGDRVWTISKNAFRECRNLTNVTLGNNVMKFGDYAFYGCTNLNIALTLGETVGIGNYTFSGCENLTAVTFGNYISIGDYAFSGCTNLTSIEMPTFLGTLSKKAFANSNIKSVTWRVWSSSQRCDFGNQVETFIFNGPQVQSIPDSICFGMSNLKSITFHHASIGERAFAHCPSLNSVTCMHPFPSHFTHDVLESIFELNGSKIDTLYIGSSDTYKNTDWADFFEIILPLKN